jgi:hypothetical protein
VHRLERLDERKAEVGDRLGARGVLQQVEELAVGGAHLLGVGHLVPPHPLEERAEKLGVPRELAARGEVAALGEVVRGHDPGQQRENLFVLALRALGRVGGEGRRVDVRRVLRHAHHPLEQPQQLALLHREPQRHVPRALDKPLAHLALGGRVGAKDAAELGVAAE